MHQTTAQRQVKTNKPPPASDDAAVVTQLLIFADAHGISLDFCQHMLNAGASEAEIVGALHAIIIARNSPSDQTH